MTNFKITITSDIVCPWCYIGHTRLGRAISTHLESNPDDKFTLKYLPFYLQPPPQSATAFPIPSRPRREVYATKFGAERAKHIEKSMIEVSHGEGLDFKFGGMTGPSRNGHRLVYHAQQVGGEDSQNQVMLNLWRKYFEQEIDITTLDTLTQVGVESGLGADKDVRAYLESGKDGDVVDDLAEEAYDRRITGVPHYLIQDRWEVSGAQDPRAFLQLFKRWKEREEKPEKQNGSAAVACTTKDECL